MKSQAIRSDPSGTAYMVVFDQGEEIADGLKRFAKDRALTAARISGVEGMESAKLGFFDPDSRSYVDIPVDEQVEVLSFDGDVTLAEEEPKVHVHAILGRRDGATVGGHLMEGRVRPTMEVMIVESPAELRRVPDERSGLELIDPEA